MKQFKLAKGWRQIVKEEPHNSSHNSSLDLKSLEQYLEYIFKISTRNLENLKFGNHCIEKGFVVRSTKDLAFCNNPNCKTCRSIESFLNKKQ